MTKRSRQRGPRSTPERKESEVKRDREGRPRTMFAAADLVALTLLAYVPAIQGGFVWDDDSMLTDNFVIKEHGLYRAWFTTKQLNYWPVTSTSYWLEHKFWGLNPIGYHVTNILLHAASALLVWRILLRLRIPGA
jgi:hypothetical protein